MNGRQIITSSLGINMNKRLSLQSSGRTDYNQISMMIQGESEGVRKRQRGSQ
jgi:hypothetical protein